MPIGQFYQEDIVATYASICEFFYEFLDMEYEEPDMPSESERLRILQAAMDKLGHGNLDMDKLERSLTYYLENGDLQANPAYDIECPDFEELF